MASRAVGPTVALNDQQLADLNSKLIAARTEVAEKKARVDFLAEFSRGQEDAGLVAGLAVVCVAVSWGPCVASWRTLHSARPICWRATTAAIRRW